MLHIRQFLSIPLFAALIFPVSEIRAQAAEPAIITTAPSSKPIDTPNATADRAKVIFKAAFELFKEGQMEAAEIQFKKGLEVDPTSAIAHYYLAEIQARLHKPDAAKEHYEAVIKLAPDSKEAALVAVVLHKAEQQGPGKVIKDCPDCPEMVIIPPGKFEMGSSNDDKEKPVHSVSINAFSLGKTEVTQGQWRSIMGNNPSKFSSCGDDCPVEQVSWNDAQAFIQKLNAKTGKQYRLPSEAEWEYACRAGGQHQYCGSDNVDSVAWYESNSGDSTHQVSHKQPNAFGLYDMSGNVWEWVEDSSHDSYNGAPTNGSVWPGDGAKRVLRGGSWVNESQNVRGADRNRDGPAFRYGNFGFRVARMLP